MSVRRAAFGVVMSSALLIGAACGDVNADLSPPEEGVAIAFDGGRTSQILTESLPVTCPLWAPIPAFLADGGSFKESVDADGGKINPRPFPDSCDRPGACEYGTSADRQCNRLFTCNGAEWAEMPSAECHAEVCPAVTALTAQLDGTPCSIDESSSSEAVCNVSDGACACTTGSGGTNVHERRWACSRTLLRDCPSARPLIGQPCGGDVYCDYGACTSKRAFAMACHLGAWQVVPALCGN